MNHNIDIFTELEITQDIKDLLLLSAIAVLDYEDVKFGCHIDIEITTNEEIREINKEQRDKDYATDVLSFPLVEFLNGKCLEDIKFCIDQETKLVPLGDMVISYDKILEQALEFGHSNEREFAFLTVHSVLHLLGYDHEDEGEDAKLMRQKEKEIMEILEINR